MAARGAEGPAAESPRLSPREPFEAGARPPGRGAWCGPRPAAVAAAAAELASRAELGHGSGKMFSALKKLVGSEQAPGREKNIPAGLQSMNQALQRRFAKGVQYNSEWTRGRGKWGALAVAPGTRQKPARGAPRGLSLLGPLAVCGLVLADPVRMF